MCGTVPSGRAGGPGQVRSRGAWLLAGLAPALAFRLRRRRRAAWQVISRGGHRGIAAIAAQPAPQLPDRGSVLLQHAGLLGDHRTPGSARRATRRRRQNGHNRPSSSPALSNQHDTPGRLQEDRLTVSLARPRHQTPRQADSKPTVGTCMFTPLRPLLTASARYAQAADLAMTAIAISRILPRRSLRPVSRAAR